MIVGAGICGLATAVALKRYGIQAVVVERAESLRTTGASITLASNAWLALEALGVSHKLNPHYPTLNKYDSVLVLLLILINFSFLNIVLTFPFSTLFFMSPFFSSFLGVLSLI